MIEVGDVVKLQKWVTSDHMATLWLRFDDDQMKVLRKSTFEATDVYHHDKFGMVACSAMLRMARLPRGVWLDWEDQCYIKVCYLEVVRGRQAGDR